MKFEFLIDILFDEKFIRVSSSQCKSLCLLIQNFLKTKRKTITFDNTDEATHF